MEKKLTPTTLSRQFAEEMCSEMEDSFEKGEAINIFELHFNLAIGFLKERFCIVEKDKAADLCRLTFEHGNSDDYGLIDGLTDIVCDIFPEQYQQVLENEYTNPEIAKEVEG